MKHPFMWLSTFVISASSLWMDLAAQSSGKAASLRPNIVLFIADDLGWKDIGAYGNQVVKTPNLDRLSGESLRFTHAFASSPTCAPSRSSLFTGLMPFRHGAHGNHSGVKDKTLSLAKYMQQLEYRVAIAGKLHVGPQKVFPFERISKTNVPEPGFEAKPGLNYDLNMDPIDTWLSDQAHDKPFLLIVADHSPHVIWPEKSNYNPEAVDIPSVHIDTQETRKARARYYEDITKMDRNVGQLIQSLNEQNLLENTVMVFTADHGPQWPFAKWSLYDYGIRAPLVVRWPGIVKAGSHTSAMVSQVDLVPTFIEIAGGSAPENIDGKSFLRVLRGETDVHRSVVFATHTGDGMMNRSPSRMLRTERYKYILNLAPKNPYHTHMDKANDHDGGREYWTSWVEKAKTDKHAQDVLQRYHDHPGEELYDLHDDPDEKHNLSADDKHTKLIDGYRKELSAWRRRQGDFETGPEKLDTASQKKGKTPVAPYVFRE
jgi:uncharacterized sulfatase